MTALSQRVNDGSLAAGWRNNTALGRRARQRQLARSGRTTGVDYTDSATTTTTTTTEAINAAVNEWCHRCLVTAAVVGPSDRRPVPAAAANTRAVVATAGQWTCDDRRLKQLAASLTFHAESSGYCFPFRRRRRTISRIALRLYVVDARVCSLR